MATLREAIDVFGWLARAGGVEAKEMLRTFNCGIGMIAVTAPADAPRVAEALAAAGLPPVRLGSIVPQDGAERVAYRGTLAL